MYGYSGDVQDRRNTDVHGTPPCAAREPFDFGVELQQKAQVTQGGDVDISTFVNNRASARVSNVTTELLVDSDADGSYVSDEAVVSTLEEYGGGKYTEVNLSYTNVQLQPGEYDYISRVSKDGQVTRSFTTGTLNVSGERKIASDNPLGNENGEALGTTQVLTKLAEWSDTGGQNGGKIDGKFVSAVELLEDLAEWSDAR